MPNAARAQDAGSNPAAATPTNGTQSTVNLTEAAAADLQHQVAILNDPAADTKARDEAARRLLARQVAQPQAKQLLLSALVNVANPRAQLAVARAMGSDLTADPAFVDPLFALIGPDRPLSDAACRALANYKGNLVVLNRLMELAQNPGRENARAAAAASLGGFAEKRVARVLVEINRNDSEPAVVRHAAADALIEMTGLTENSRDVSRWNRWWAAHVAQTDAAFREELLVTRSVRLDAQRLRQEQLTEELGALLTDQYQATNDVNKDTLLLKWMRSNEPAVRVKAAELVVEDFQYNRPFGQPVKDQLRTMVGDSSALVRLQIARTLRTINDTAALEALLTQLAQEPVAENRAAIALALGQIQDLRSVPELEKLLAESEPTSVSEAAADSLARLGPLLREKNPAGAKETAERLRTVLERRANQPGSEKLREAVAEALIPLRDPDSLPVYFRLLNLRESERTRRASLKGIAEMHDQRAADPIVDWLKTEPVAAVRIEAVAAIGATSRGTEHFETLYQRMQPAVEPDGTVREQAWKVFQSLLPEASTEQINRWTTRFQGAPDRRVIVLKALADKLLGEKKLNDLAQTRQSIGESLMKTTPPQPAEAETYFRLALEYYRQEKNTPGQITETLVRQRMEALLSSRQYTEVARFASEMIKANAENQQTVGSLIRMETERLRDAGDLQNALKLIAEARSMNPPLIERYNRMLEDISTEIQNRLTNQNQKNGSVGPRVVFPSDES